MVGVSLMIRSSQNMYLYKKENIINIMNKSLNNIEKMLSNLTAELICNKNGW